MVRVGTHNEPLLQHRSDVIADEMDPALHPNCLADRRRLHRAVSQESEDPFDNRRIAAREGQMDKVSLGRVSILGALSLYLDFVNLFLYLLRLMGRRR